MKYSWSVEADADVAGLALLTGNSTETVIRRRLNAGELKRVDLHIGYVPIVMAPCSPDWYPARTKLRKKQRLLDCAPKLNPSAFRSNSDDAMAEWIGGIRDCLPLLADMSLSVAEIAELDAFFCSVAEELGGGPTNA